MAPHGHDNSAAFAMFNDANFTKVYAESAEKMTGHFAGLLIEQSKLNEVPDDKDLIVLDQACGTGIVSEHLVRALNKSQQANLDLTCADFADSMVTFAGQRIRTLDVKSAHAIKADAMDTKLPSDKFTHVLLNFGPMIFSDWKVGMAELHRILQPGGTLAMSSWMRLGWPDDIRNAFATDPEIPPLPSSKALCELVNSNGRWSDAAWIRDSVVQSGFVDVNVREVPNTSILSGVDKLIPMMTGMLGMVQQRTWTAEQRERYKDRATNAVISYMKQKYGNGEIKWDWIAILTTAKRAV
ncbi:uncharacterized protein Z520_08091 [Fonsecaea multimorphosa CBS 102226]|uniref:Methyltransferase domain-containing protein n=1 Tax=Fonsecaea multimorphosa CBS 102226 TaxID=1442371 RepID=A0A0D2KI35_9EURO|nr:uncharacterized protein Z520_08091 [Fonsecaea multimorphosa CBS 102226]KIX96313.1 hypothetical protein Z520_08091 [Fonsecaea multimorphosa CBS 102226]OAL21973.1 hypothetical protein AYO22_07570 [Fonsecaea multimorphosa]